MGETTSVREIDVAPAARALAATELVESAARVLYVLAAPLTAFVLVSELAHTASLEARAAAGGMLGLALLLVTLIVLTFARLTLRPLLGAVMVAIVALPAALAASRYFLSGADAAEAMAFLAAVLVVFSAPFLWAWAQAARVPRASAGFARAAPKPLTVPTLLRTIFGVWPGLRRSLLSATVATVLAHAATLLAWTNWLVLTPLALLLTVLSPVLLQREGPLPLALAAGALVLAAWLSSATQAGLRAAARYCSRSSFAAQVERDRRPPILFLRSFQDDQVTLRDRGPLARLARLVFSLGLDRRRLDHLLVERFSRFGPALALGKPGEKDLPFGAARVYPSHDRWQAVVAEVAERARAVVLVADRTPGVEWEVRTFLDGPWRSKTLFLSAGRGRDLRDNPILADRLAAEGVEPAGRPVLAAYWAEDGRLTVLRGRSPWDAPSFLAALNGFFGDA